MNLATKLRDLRHDASLTQRQLADAAGLRQADICDAENGKGVLTHSAERLLALCQALGVEPAVLLDAIEQGECDET